MFKFVMFYHMDNLNSTKVAILGLNQIWDCALNWSTVEPVHECILDICPLRSFGATNSKHVFG